MLWKKLWYFYSVFLFLYSDLIGPFCAFLVLCFFFFFFSLSVFNFILAMPRSLQDLNSLTRDWTRAMRRVLTTRPPGNSRCIPISYRCKGYSARRNSLFTNFFPFPSLSFSLPHHFLFPIPSLRFVGIFRIMALQVFHSVLNYVTTHFRLVWGISLKLKIFLICLIYQGVIIFIYIF